VPFASPRAALRAGNAAEAERLARMALEANGAAAEAHHALGTVAFHRGDLARAAPEEAAPHFEAGSIEFGRFPFERALEAFRRASERDPKHVAARANLPFSKAQVCDWSDWEAEVDALRELVARELAADRPSPLPPHSSIFVPFTGAERLAIARKHAEGIAERVAKLAGRREEADGAGDDLSPLDPGSEGERDRPPGAARELGEELAIEAGVDPQPLRDRGDDLAVRHFGEELGSAALARALGRDTC
jgi:tetratricopeptide (TPR) repeat protein